MTPPLSIIVPVLNEAPRIAPLLLMLASQEGIDVETILCDGGSTDGTLDQARNLAGSLPYPLRLVTSPRGRGVQMNRGAAAAAAEWFLFLHADSAFPDPRALRRGLSLLMEAALSNDRRRIAGRFALRFDTAGRELRFGYRFCEGKASLGRPGCVLGDQGFLLSRELYREVGPFDEELPVAEDVEYAERLRSRGGEFLLLPAEILTSPRRFETEGYRPRQSLNALIMGLLFTGRHDLLSALSGCYRSHGDGRTLDLEPFFREIAAQISRLPLRERLEFWYRIGTYVRANAWQLAYLLDLRRDWRKGMHLNTALEPRRHGDTEKFSEINPFRAVNPKGEVPNSSPSRATSRSHSKVFLRVSVSPWWTAFSRMKGGEGEAPMLALYDRYLDRLTDHPPGRTLTAGAVWLWFTLARHWGWLREG